MCHTLRRDHCGRWYLLVEFQYDTDIQYKNRTAEVGIDLGLRTFAMLSDGLKINNPHIGIKYRRKLSACCSKIGCCHDYRAFLPAADKFWNLWERKYDKERNFIHQVTRSLVNSYDVFYVEDLDVEKLLSKNENNRELSLQIMDSRWRLFISTLTYKAAGAGKRVILVNPANTSQICSNCGAVVKKVLNDRQHVCPQCGLSIDRDLNAARNILRRGARRASKRANAPERSSQTLFSPELIKELTDKYKHLFGTL